MGNSIYVLINMLTQAASTKLLRHYKQRSRHRRVPWHLVNSILFQALNPMYQFTANGPDVRQVIDWLMWGVRAHWGGVLSWWAHWLVVCWARPGCLLELRIRHSPRSGIALREMWGMHWNTTNKHLIHLQMTSDRTFHFPHRVHYKGEYRTEYSI